MLYRRASGDEGHIPEVRLLVLHRRGGRTRERAGGARFIHCVVETLDRHFGNVCELDIMFHLEKAHYILEEMVMNGQIVETNKSIILGQTVMYDPPPEK